MEKIQLLLHRRVDNPVHIMSELVKLYNYTINGENPPPLCTDQCDNIIRVSRRVENQVHIMSELTKLYNYTINGQNPPPQCEKILAPALGDSVEVQPRPPVGPQPQPPPVNNQLSDTSLKTLSYIVGEQEHDLLSAQSNDIHINVPSGTKQIKIKAQPTVNEAKVVVKQSSKTIRQNQKGLSGFIQLNKGPKTTTDITLTVTAKNPTITKNYTVHVIKDPPARPARLERPARPTPSGQTDTPKLVITMGETGTKPEDITCDVRKLGGKSENYDDIEEITIVKLEINGSFQEVVAWRKDQGSELIDGCKFIYTPENTTAYLQCKGKRI